MLRGLKSVFTFVDADNKFDAFNQIIQKCTVFDLLEDKESFRKKVERRERTESTGVGHGVAIAHGKIDHLEKCHIALGFSKNGIIFDQRYPDPVHFIFVIASSRTRQAEYLHAVSAILSWVHDDDFRHEFMKCEFEKGKAREFLKILSSQDFRCYQR